MAKFTIQTFSTPTHQVKCDYYKLEGEYFSFYNREPHEQVFTITKAHVARVELNKE